MTDAPGPEQDHATAAPVPAGLLQDLALAMVLLTRIPIRLIGHADARRSLAAIWAYPLVGATVGLSAGLTAWTAHEFALPSLVAAGLALAAGIALTGALHEDGLADAADGLLGGHTPEKRLIIMRDSRTGAFGAIAIGLSLFLRGASMAAILESAGPESLVLVLVSAHAVSRGLLAGPLLWQPAARDDGLAGESGGVAPMRAATALILAAGLAVAPILLTGAATAPPQLITPLFAGAVAVLGVAWLASRLVGGYTGDTLGACQQTGEIAVLIAASALFTAPSA